MAAFIAAGIDTHRDAAVRRVLAPLAALAESGDFAVLGVAHLTKDLAGKLLNRVGGSVAFGAAPRSVLAFARHPDDPDGERGDQRVIVHAKSNHGRFAPTLAVHIESHEVEDVGEVGRLVFGDECDVGPEDLGGATTTGPADCEDAISATLADGPRASVEVKMEVRRAVGCSTATIKRAASRMQGRGDLQISQGGFPCSTDTKTRQHRTVRLLAPLNDDLAPWRLACGQAGDGALVFPSASGAPWTQAAYQSWRRRAFRRALDGAGIEDARPYDLRHSFASLLLHEGRSVIYVARQLGHDARLTLTRYGHVIDELEDAPQLDAESASLAARNGAVANVDASGLARFRDSPMR